MTGFHIDTTEVRQSSERLVGVVDRMAEAITRLESELSAQGQPWGTGLIGTLIGQLYDVVHEVALNSFEKNAEVISEYADSLDGMADAVDDLEDVITEGIRSLGNQVPGR